MTQKEFFNIIMDELKELPELELQKLISLYRNRISNEVLSGKSEEEVIKSFGDPYLICINYKKNGLDTKNFKDEYTTSPNINIKKSVSNNTSNDLNMLKDNYIESVNMTPNNTKKSHQNQNTNIKNNSSSPHVNKLLKICIIVLSIIIFSPLLTSILGIIIGVLGVSFSLLAGSIGVLVGSTFTSLVEIPNIPHFIADFPYPAIVLISLGSIFLSIFFLFIFYYLCKLFFRFCKRLITFLKSKGGCS